MKILISEIIEEFKAANTRQEKITVLRKYDNPRFRLFFEILYGSYQFDVEIPKYKPAPEPIGMSWTCLETELPKLSKFMKGSVVTPEKKKSLLLVLLESLYKDEAEILVKLIMGDLGVKYLTPKIIKEAFPDIQI